MDIKKVFENFNRAMKALQISSLKREEEEKRYGRKHLKRKMKNQVEEVSQAVDNLIWNNKSKFK